MMISIDEMAENAKKMIAGEAIVNLRSTCLMVRLFPTASKMTTRTIFFFETRLKNRGSRPILVRPTRELRRAAI